MTAMPDNVAVQFMEKQNAIVFFHGDIEATFANYGHPSSSRSVMH